MPEHTDPQRRRVVLITGGSDGIGRVTARDLAARGDTVVVVSRPHGEGPRVVDRIRSETGGDVHHLGADLARLADARAMIAAFRERWSRLDALVLNAGAYFARRQETDEGIERTWALNHLSPVLTAVLLAEALLASAPARVVLTSSNAANAGRIAWDDPEMRHGYQGMRAYAQSKLANQLTAAALARRFDDRGVAVHAMHPGFVATGFGQEAGAAKPVFRVLQRLFGRTPAQGADTLTYLATDDAALGTSGGYWVDRRRRPMAPGARDPHAAERLWGLSVARAGLSEDDLAPLAGLPAIVP